MPAEEIQFRVAFEGPLTEFTVRHPEAHVSLWCDWKREAIEVRNADPAAIAELRELLRARASWIESYAVGPSATMFFLDCIGLPHDFVNEAVDFAHGLAVPPTRFEGGSERYTVVSFSEGRTRDLFQRLRESGRKIEVLSRKPLGVQPLLNVEGFGVAALLDGLTVKQMEAIVTAHRHGFYDAPRATTAASIAEGVGLSRSTYEEHLRKAESRIVTNVLPYLELMLKVRQGAAAPAPPA